MRPLSKPQLRPGCSPRFSDSQLASQLQQAAAIHLPLQMHSVTVNGIAAALVYLSQRGRAASLQRSAFSSQLLDERG
jgi:hypothetical protein